MLITKIKQLTMQRSIPEGSKHSNNLIEIGNLTPDQANVLHIYM